MMRRPLFVASLLISVLGVPAPFAAADEQPRSYIVVLKDGANSGRVADEHEEEYGADTEHVYKHALKGYAAEMTPEDAQEISEDSRVLFVEPDGPMSISAQTNPTGIRRIFATSNPNLDIDATDDLRVDVDVAIIDTGVDFDHPDLNVVHRANCTVTGICSSNAGDDDNGHGSHVGGIVGALDNNIGVVGVAPGARLWSVKVLAASGDGIASWVIAGIDYVTARASQIEVANVSIGGGNNSAVCTAVNNSINAGIVYAVSAGNESQNAANSSPANCAGVLTTSAIADFDGSPGALAPNQCSDEDDTLSWFSNWGSTVEIAAPGSCIYSTYANGGYGTVSGTSQASPHVAGAAAVLASVNNPQNASDVAAIRSTITGAGNFNWTDTSGDGIKEPLLDVSNSGTFAPVMAPGSQPNNQPPTATIFNPGNGSTVSGIVTIQVQATDAEDPAGSLAVDVRIDGGAWQTAPWNSGTGRYERNWDTTTVANGSHTIDARATDSASQVANAAQIAVTVSNGGPPPDPWQLQVTGTQQTDRQIVKLYWNSGAAPTTKVDIFRDGSKIKRTANDGYYRDIVQPGIGSHAYKVCQAGKPSNCSSTKTVF